MAEVDIIAKLEPVVDSALTACYYRILGQASLPFTIDEFIEFVEAEIERGKYGGSIEWRVNLDRFKWFVWRDINMSKPGAVEKVTFSTHVWGITKKYGARNVVLSRTGFWRMYVIRSRIERWLGLRPYALAPLR